MSVAAATARTAPLPRRRWQVELRMFLVAYLVYTAARWIFVGDLGGGEGARSLDLRPRAGRRHGRRGLRPGRSTRPSCRGASQQPLPGRAAGGGPGPVVWLDRRSPVVYRELRNTVVATWLIAVPASRCSRSRRRGSPTSASPTRSASRRPWSSPGARRSSTTSSPPCRASTWASRLRWACALGACLGAALGQGARAAVGAARLALGGGDGQPLPVRHRRRSGRHRPGLRGGPIENPSTGMASRNVDLIRPIYEDWGRGNWRTALTFMTSAWSGLVQRVPGAGRRLRGPERPQPEAQGVAQRLGVLARGGRGLPRARRPRGRARSLPRPRQGKRRGDPPTRRARLQAARRQGCPARDLR